MLTKEAKTAKELQTEISSYLGGLDVIVYDDCTSGWTAALFVPPGEASDTQQFVEIISELRTKYDLKKEPEISEPDHLEATMPLTEPGVAAEEPSDD
ncbi:MAG: hypothetical protein U1E81_18405 [Xanthobacteraceae bacterium]